MTKPKQIRAMRSIARARRAVPSLARSLAHGRVEERARAKGDPLRPMDELTDSNTLLWLWTWLQATLFRWTREKLPPYTDAPNNAIYRIPERCRIGVAADWGAATEPAVRVAEGIRSQAPDFTIHMGDVYFAGDPLEYERIFLGTPPNSVGSWPRGKHVPTAATDALPAYAMNGNHEMFCGGYGYFGDAFRALGQRTSFFTLENAHWRIVALDTGYNTPRNGLTQLIDDTLLHLANALPAPNFNWLARVVFADAADTRPVILLSHHQPLSAYERDYPRIAKQLGPWLDRVALWFWGHEHRMALYETVTVEGRRVRGRCIGHGGMPDEPNYTPTRAPWKDHVVLTQKNGRGVPDGDGHLYGYCGWITFELDGAELRVRYYEEDPSQTHAPFRPPERPLLEEVWTALAGGACRGAVTVCDESKLSVLAPHTVADFVK